MERSDILDGSKMIQQSTLNDIILREENEKLQALSEAFNSIAIDSALEGEAADAIRQQMLDYKNLIDSAISINSFDITDNTTAYFSFIEYYFDGEVIIQSLTDAQNDLEHDEKQKNYHYEKWMDSYDEILGIYTGSYHMTMYLYYCGCVSSDEEEIEYWENVINTFDGIVEATSGLFADSVTVREAIKEGLASLQENYVDGNYQVDLNADWRLALENAFSTLFDNRYRVGESDSGTLDVDKVFEDMCNVDEMSDAEYQAYIKALQDMGIDIDDDCPRDELMDRVMEDLEDKYYNNITYDSAGNEQAPFYNMTDEQRELYVDIYEIKHPEDAENMNELVNQLGEGDNYYDGWETDAINIKFLVYTADEPYRSAFINNADEITIMDTRAHNNAHCSGSGIYVDVDAYDLHDLEYYSVIIHESSHAVFNITKESDEYEKEVTQSMVEDLENRINDEVDDWIDANMPSLSEAEKEELKSFIVDCIMNQVDVEKFGGVDFDYLINDENGYDLNVNITADQAQACYDSVVSDLRSDIGGSVSDTYGGLTGNTVGISGHYHPATNEGNPDKTYWLEGTDEVNGVEIDFTDDHFDDNIIISDEDVDYNEFFHATEMFAEGMDSHITRRPYEVEHMENYSTDTLDQFEDRAEAASNYGN